MMKSLNKPAGPAPKTSPVERMRFRKPPKQEPVKKTISNPNPNSNPNPKAEGLRGRCPVDSRRRTRTQKPGVWKLLSNHVIGSFQLKFNRRPEKGIVEITATVPSPQLPEEEDVERLYELFICNSQGRLLAKIPFLESDYRKAARQAINSLTDGEKE